MRRFLDVRPAGSCCTRLSRPLPNRVFLSAFFVVTLVWPIGLLGQSIQVLGRGDRVRVTPREGPSLKGSYEGMSPAGLSLLDAADGRYTIPIPSLRSLEVAAGRNRGRGALIGGGVGLVAGLLLGAVTSGDCIGDCEDPYGVGGGGLAEAKATGIGALLGGVILGGVGAGVGAIFLAPERWVTIDLDPAGRITSMVRLRR